MKNLMVLVAVVLLGGCSKDKPAPLPVAAVPAPATYEDCILQSLKPGQNNTATDAIIEACRVKFPEPAAKPTSPPVAHEGNPYLEDEKPKAEAAPDQDEGDAVDPMDTPSSGDQSQPRPVQGA